MYVVLLIAHETKLYELNVAGGDGINKARGLIVKVAARDLRFCWYMEQHANA
jgi:hypothetical protein